MSNIIDKIQLSGVTYDIGGGGGKAVTAGTNISVTTGETADTINCTLPITIDSNDIKGDIAIGTNLTGASSNYHNLLIGRRIEIGNESTSNKNIGIGFNTNTNTSTTFRNTIYGTSNVGIGGNFEIGTSSNVRNNSCVVIGYNAKSKIDRGVAIGSNTVASGTTKTNINNQLTIDTSNQVYIYNKDNTEMICLQDQLGGGGSSYSAGTGIDITNDVISVTGKQDTLISGTNIKTVNNESILGSGNITIQGGGSPVVELTQAQYDALQTIDPDTIYVITDAQGGDLSQYMTSAQTVNAISTAVASKVDTSAITTTITSSSTNSQVPSAKAVYDIVGNIETLLSQI